jgi:hypothetical protein
MEEIILLIIKLHYLKIFPQNRLKGLAIKKICSTFAARIERIVLYS